MSSHTLLTLRGRELRLESSSARLVLTASQRDLIQCILTGLNDKSAIIEKLWGPGHKSGNGNNLSQLVFRLRNDLRQAGFPANLFTVSRQCIFIDGQYVMPVAKPCPHKVKKLNDSGIFFTPAAEEII